MPFESIKPGDLFLDSKELGCPVLDSEGRPRPLHAAPNFLSPIASVVFHPHGSALLTRTCMPQFAPVSQSPAAQISNHPVPRSLVLTKHRLKQLEAIKSIREQREARKQQVAYNARPFVLCGIPLRPQPKDQLTYLRRNGKFSLEIIGHPRFGLPYGQDRLIPIWLATLALRQKSQVVHFETAAELLDFFRLSRDGRHYRRLVQGFKRLFAATIFFGTEDQPSGGRLMDWERFHFIDQMRLWFNGNGQREKSSGVGPNNTLTLSEAFYREIDEHRIPVEREVVAALNHTPGALDFYLWIAWKSWTLNGSSARIPLFGAGGLGEQLGVKRYTVDRTFRLTISRWLRTVKALWPECPAALSKDGKVLIVHSSRNSPALNTSREKGPGAIMVRKCPSSLLSPCD